MRQVSLLLQKLSTPAVVVLCIVAAITFQVQQLKMLTSRSTGSVNLKQGLEQEKLRLDFLQQAPTFGFNNLVANWVFLSFIQYFGDVPARQATGYALSSSYFEVIVELDPKFLDIYPFLSTTISMYAAMPEQSVALMEKGLRSLAPKAPLRSYYVWRYKGIDELLFLGDSQAAQYSFETAADWASVYSNSEGQRVAAISRKTARSLARNPESKSAQASAWLMVLGNAFDDRTRQLAISRIESLGGKVTITPQGEVKVQLPKAD